MTSSPIDVEDLATPENLEEQTEVLLEKIRRTAEEIRALLREDLPDFVAREVKTRFLEGGEFSSKLDEAQIKDIKDSAVAVGAEVAKEVDDTLAPLDPWLAGLELGGDHRHISENTEVWARVEQVNHAVERLLGDKGFPRVGAAYGVSYKEPARFIHGRYLPTLSERYWKLIAELLNLRSQVAAQLAARSRSDLVRRWDES